MTNRVEIIEPPRSLFRYLEMRGHMKWILIALIVSPTGALLAQQRSDPGLVAVAAAKFSLARFPDKVVGFDVTPVEGRGAQASWSPEEVRIVATMIRAKKTGPTRDFFSCASLAVPSSCRVTGADLVISFSYPEISDGEAFINLRILAPTGLARVPVVRSDTRLHLVRETGGWIVKRIVGRSTT